MPSPTSLLKRLLLGRPFRSDRLGETLLSKRLALPIFASDPLSSVAYATQEILLVLTLGGLAYLYLAPWVGLAVVTLLAVVVVPTYLFVVGVLVLIAVGFGQTLFGDAPVAESAGWDVKPEQVGLAGLGVAFLALRAFSSGCTALTGAEAISNGVPAFKPPKSETPPRRWPRWASCRSSCSPASPRWPSSPTCGMSNTPAT